MDDIQRPPGQNGSRCTSARRWLPPSSACPAWRRGRQAARGCARPRHPGARAARRRAAALPLGPDGAPVTVDVETATVMVADPAPATLFALWAEPIFNAFLVQRRWPWCRRAPAHPRRARTRLRAWAPPDSYYAALSVFALWWFGDAILTNMTTNGALAAISDHTYDSVTFTSSFAPLIADSWCSARVGARS